jgi:transcriptional regulator with XRE-family HTH domain
MRRVEDGVGWRRQLATRLLQARKERCLSQERLAKRMGLTIDDASAITKWEKGPYAPDAENIRNLAIALNVSADWLLGVSEIRSRPMRCDAEPGPHDPNWRKQLSMRLQKARRDRRLPQRAVWRNDAMPHHWENGYSTPSTQSLRELAPALNVSVDWLLGIG